RCLDGWYSGGCCRTGPVRRCWCPHRPAEPIARRWRGRDGRRCRRRCRAARRGSSAALLEWAAISTWRSPSKALEINPAWEGWFRLNRVEADIEDRGRMGQGADRDDVDAGLSDGPDGL